MKEGATEQRETDGDASSVSVTKSAMVSETKEIGERVSQPSTGDTSGARYFFRKYAKTVEAFYVAVLVQLVAPLVVFVPELFRSGHIRREALGAGGSIYTLGLAVACRKKWAQTTAGIMGLFAAAVYGFDPSYVTPLNPVEPLAQWQGNFPLALMVVAMLVYFADCLWHHVVSGRE